MESSTNSTVSEQDSKQNFSKDVFVGVARGIGNVRTHNMSFHSVDYILQNVQPGDILEFNRKLYSHYALYLGHSKVMNIEAEEFDSTEALICERTLEEVCKDSMVRVRNHDDIAREHFQTSAKTVDEILDAAKSFENKVVLYQLDFCNCEYYSTLWRHGKGFSTQVAKPSSTPGGKMLSGVITSWETTKSTLTEAEAFRESGQYAKYKSLTNVQCFIQKPSP